jgi:ActR/RegA family two-component response regulator
MVCEATSALQEMHRTLETDFHIEFAEGARQGLATLQSLAPFAVVVVDLNLQHAETVAFLADVKAAAPEALCIMLCDQNAIAPALAVVNECNVFRLLSKPCAPEELVKALGAAADLHALLTAKAARSQRTLSESIGFLMDVLAVTHPELFLRVVWIRWYVAIMAREARLRDAWQFEMAAVLSQIGPLDSLPAGQAGNPPGVSPNPIPGLETVAEIVVSRDRPYRDFVKEGADATGHIVALGAEMLHIAVALERLTAEGRDLPEAIVDLIEQPEEYNPELLWALHDSSETAAGWQPSGGAGAHPALQGVDTGHG